MRVGVVNPLSPRFRDPGPVPGADPVSALVSAPAERRDASQITAPAVARGVPGPLLDVRRHVIRDRPGGRRLVDIVHRFRNMPVSHGRPVAAPKAGRRHA